MFSNNSSIFGNTNSKIFRNNKPSICDIGILPKECKHNDKCAFYLSNGVNFICYNCIYKYNLNKDLCIPINNNDFNNYTDLCKDYFNKIRNKIKNIFKEILDEIDKLELDKMDNINSILNKININFRLPIEVPFKDRLKIGINN